MTPEQKESSFDDGFTCGYAQGILSERQKCEEQVKLLKEALEFECGNRCAHQNPCNAKEVLEKLTKKIKKKEKIK